MRKGRAMLLAGAMLAATALVVSLVSAASAGPNLLRVSVIEHATTDTVVHLTPGSADATGDLLTFHNEIFDTDNTTAIGSDQGECVRIEVGVSWECRWVTTLEVGSITVEGPFYDAASSILAITGGTGEFRGARGTMRLVARGNPLGSEYAFNFRLLTT